MKPTKVFKTRMIARRYCLLMTCAFILLLPSCLTFAQDPVLPSTNLGLTNIMDGYVPGPGWYFMNYTQVYESRRLKDGSGEKVSTDLEVGSLLNLTQLVYLSKIKVAGGNLGFITLVPIVKISATSSSDVPNVNPNVLGDVVFATAIQWLDKKFLNKPISHRAEVGVTIPVGSFDSEYAINASANLYTISAYHSFSYLLSKNWSTSMRNTLNYNTKIRNTEIRPGSFYTCNYSIGRTLFKSLRLELVGYYLLQLEEDSYANDHRFYKNTYGIQNTKEQVLGIGPGIAYITPTRFFLEAKVFFETNAENRFEGYRPTLRVIYKLDK